MIGKIIKINAGFYDIFSDGKVYRVRGSGKLKFDEFVPLVGDKAEFEVDGFLHKIFERENEFVRPKVANIDSAVIVCSLVAPDYSSFLLNKMLITVESKDIHPIIVFTKRDLATSSPIEEYLKYGYEAYEISNEEKLSKDHPIFDSFKDKVILFMGQTGAGKSSTINNLTDSDLETQEISKALGRGKHTTRVVEMHPWNGGWLIDTPGFSSFELYLDKQEMARSFKKFRKAAEECKFRTCLHWKETSCKVKELVEKNEISKVMYDDYIKMIKNWQQGHYERKK